MLFDKNKSNKGSSGKGKEKATIIHDSGSDSDADDEDSDEESSWDSDSPDLGYEVDDEDRLDSQDISTGVLAKAVSYSQTESPICAILASMIFCQMHPLRTSWA